MLQKCRSAGLSIFVVLVADSGMKKGRRRANRGLQVIVPDPLESVVAMEIIPADVVCRVGGADPPEGHRAQLGLNGIITCIISVLDI